MINRSIEVEALNRALDIALEKEYELRKTGQSHVIEPVILAIKEALRSSPNGEAQPEPKCNPHPKAPHGFDRNASHANDRYVCECEGWDAYDAGYEAGVIAGIEASMEQEPEQRSDNELLEPVAWAEFDGEGGYHFRAYEDNEDYAEQWDKRNPNHVGWVKPLYTTPPQHSANARSSSATPLTWEGLTDEERWDCLEVSRRNADCRDALVKAVEAKLKAKNERKEKNT